MLPLLYIFKHHIYNHRSAWVGSRLPPHTTSDTTTDVATRTGSLALLLNAILSILATFIIPRLLLHPPAAAMTKKEEMEVRRNGSICRRVATIPGVWAMSLILFGVLLIASIAVWPGSGTSGALLIVALCGLSWGVAQWVPFAVELLCFFLTISFN